MRTAKTEAIEKLVNDAIYLCRNGGSASPYLFQRVLGIDLRTAFIVFDELVQAAVIINVHTEEYEGEVNYIGEINEKKMREFSRN